MDEPTAEEIATALAVLARCDHFDRSRRAAALLPVDMPLQTVLMASDGAQQIARALDRRQRVERGARDVERHDPHDVRMHYVGRAAD